MYLLSLGSLSVCAKGAADSLFIRMGDLAGMCSLQRFHLVSMVDSGYEMQLQVCRNLVLSVTSASLVTGGDTKKGRAASTLQSPMGG